MLSPPPCSTLFPYTTLFRSEVAVVLLERVLDHVHGDRVELDAVDALRLVVQRGDDLVAAGRSDDQRVVGRAAQCAERQRRSEEHTSELQSRRDLVCRLLLEK